MNGSSRSPVRLAALASLAAGAIHLTAIRAHVDVPASEIFFWTVAGFQLCWGAAALGRARGPSWGASAVVNSAVIAVWVASRTGGLPVTGHDAGPEPVGALDLLATGLEAIIVTASLATMTPVSTRIRAWVRAGAPMLIAAALLVGGLPVSATGKPHRGAAREAHRPHASNMVEGYGQGKVVAFTYAQQYFCTVDPYDDLDGPAHEGDGIPAAEDPNEMLAPPCIIGATRHGSVPKIDPSGRAFDDAAKLYGLIPSFDGDGDGVTEDNDPTPAVDSNCPQPGPPITRTTGTFQTCVLHPLVAHAEPYLRGLVGSTAGAATDVPAGDISVGNHSHVVGMASSGPRWWVATVVVVTDPGIWPDSMGKCPANRGCLTSVGAIRRAQNAGTAGSDIPTNVWFYFSVDPVAL